MKSVPARWEASRWRQIAATFGGHGRRNGHCHHERDGERGGRWGRGTAGFSKEPDGNTGSIVPSDLQSGAVRGTGTECQKAAGELLQLARHRQAIRGTLPGRFESWEGEPLQCRLGAQPWDSVIAMRPIPSDHGNRCSRGGFPDVGRPAPFH